MWLGRLSPAFVLVWLIVTAALIPTAWWLIRSGSAPRWRVLVMWAALGVPVAAAAASLVIFGTGTHPLVQYNDPDTLRGWGVWKHLWGALLILATGAAIVCGVLALRSRQWWRARLGWIVLLAANALALWAVFGNFPSA